MSCVSFIKGQNIPIRHYDKETETQDKIVLKAEDVKKEFSSWKTNKKKKSNTEQPTPDNEELPDKEAEQDYEPIEI